MHSTLTPKKCTIPPPAPTPTPMKQSTQRHCIGHNHTGTDRPLWTPPPPKLSPDGSLAFILHCARAII